MRQKDRDWTHRIAECQNLRGTIRQALALAFATGLILITGPNVNSAESRNVTNHWSVKIGGFCDSSAAIGSDGTIYFGTYDGALIALGPGGTRKWSFQAGREIRSSPALSTN